MFYAKIDNGENYTFRFYTKAMRDQFVADHEGGCSITAKQAKFIPGAQRHVTYFSRKADGTWCR